MSVVGGWWLVVGGRWSVVGVFESEAQPVVTRGLSGVRARPGELSRRWENRWTFGTPA